MHSNHIAEPYRHSQELRAWLRDNVIIPCRITVGYKEAVLLEVMKGTSSTRLAFRDTEDDLKLLLRILSTFHNCNPHTPSGPGNVCLDNDWHNPNRQCDSSSYYSANYILSWKTVV
jgi:hypothetical protein